jgi:hypothetical protein
VQTHPGSLLLQFAEQPSLSFVFPSSHTSPIEVLRTTPFKVILTPNTSM